METIGRVFVIQPYFKFKSYYVVWKLSLTTSIFSFSEGLNRTMQYGNEEYGNGIMSANKFKSYYVVWKRLHTRVSLCLSLRLNRTMQYGNEVENDKKIIEIMCLNRTMQYGNVLPSDSTTYTIPV